MHRIFTSATRWKCHRLRLIVLGTHTIVSLSHPFFYCCHRLNRSWNAQKYPNEVGCWHFFMGSCTMSLETLTAFLLPPINQSCFLSSLTLFPLFFLSAFLSIWQLNWIINALDCVHWHDFSILSLCGTPVLLQHNMKHSSSVLFLLPFCYYYYYYYCSFCYLVLVDEQKSSPM